MAEVDAVDEAKPAFFWRSWTGQIDACDCTDIVARSVLLSRVLLKSDLGSGIWTRTKLACTVHSHRQVLAAG